MSKTTNSSASFFAFCSCVERLARPGSNVTGLTNLLVQLGDKRLELLKEAVPKVARVAVL